MSAAQHRGEIWEVRLDKARPAAVLTRESAISSLPEIVVVPFSTSFRSAPTSVGVRCPAGVGGLQKDCVAACWLVGAAHKKRFLRRIGMLPSDYLWRIIEGVLHSLHFDEKPRVSQPGQFVHRTCRSTGTKG
ncbi:MAG: type II toxin-antitoxin system PemK/MazF family toxin [Planctomycetes bacterium]|nr:type II toxin-antitoxin system PemK/MazF family toxin [Planctomycetota bacterium]